MTQSALYSKVAEDGFTYNQVRKFLQEVLALYRKHDLKSVLILGPDDTRRDSFAGTICCICYQVLSCWCNVDFLEADGTHAPMDERRRKVMYPDIPNSHYFSHDWRNDTVVVGSIDSSTVHALSDGILEKDIPVEINRKILDPKYGLIISVGQVVPHAVAGMSNYSKNFMVGAGGSAMIHATHMIGAYYGMEKIMGLDHTPARNLMDCAQERFLSQLPILFIQTVTRLDNRQKNVLCGLFAGNDRQAYEQAVALSHRYNIIHLDHPLKTAVVWMKPEEFHSMWTANKGIYRIKRAMAQGGTLVVVAPGVSCFSEDAQMDKLIRLYGYCGKERIVQLQRNSLELRENPAVAAHLIHGSTEGKFTVYYYAPNLGKRNVEAVGYRFITSEELANLFGFPGLKVGYQDESLESTYFVENPALGLWIYEQFP